MCGIDTAREGYVQVDRCIYLSYIWIHLVTKGYTDTDVIRQELCQVFIVLSPLSHCNHYRISYHRKVLPLRVKRHVHT